MLLVNQAVRKFERRFVMKTLATLLGTIAPTTAFAAANAPAGGDGILVWIFLGFFAVIVVGQIVPAVMLVIGLVKGITAATKEKTEVR
jgi:hypothetical protein